MYVLTWICNWLVYWHIMFNNIFIIIKVCIDKNSKVFKRLYISQYSPTQILRCQTCGDIINYVNNWEQNLLRKSGTDQILVHHYAKATKSVQYWKYHYLLSKWFENPRPYNLHNPLYHLQQYIATSSANDGVLKDIL